MDGMLGRRETKLSNMTPYLSTGATRRMDLLFRRQGRWWEEPICGGRSEAPFGACSFWDTW